MTCFLHPRKYSLPIGILAALFIMGHSVMAQTGPAASPTPVPMPTPKVKIPSPALLKPVATEPWKIPSLEYFIDKLPPCPKPESFRDRLDVGDVIARQASMTPSQLQHAQWTYTFSVFTFAEVLGTDFNAKNYPQTAAFFAQVITQSNLVVSGLKNHYHRLRPFQAYPNKIKLYVKNEPGFSYPSGHTTRSRLLAYILSELDPVHRRPFLNAAEQVGMDRILAGEHYQTDLEAGRKLGKLIFYALMDDPKFRRDLQALSAAEWTRKNKTATPAAITSPSPTPSTMPQ